MTEENNTQTDTLLRRAFLFLEDGEWERADEYAEKVLDIDPENSDAYLCKLMSEFGVAHKELLSNVQEEISQSKNYINALKYANPSQKEFLEDCEHKAHARFVERKRNESNNEIIKTFSDLIETYRNTQKSNQKMIKRGRSAVKMYLTTYIVCIVYIAAMIVCSSLNIFGKFGPTIMGMGLGMGVPIFVLILWIGHARLTRFWDLDYGNDRGWTFPFFFGMINALWTLGIWGFIKSFKTRKEYRGLIENNAEMERQISDLQQKIAEKKAA